MTRTEPFPALSVEYRDNKRGFGGVPVYVYHPLLRELNGVRASGVYAIIDARTKECLYVGESHSGRLYDTITRHFRRWKIDPANDATGRRRGGTTYNRDHVLIAYTLCKPSEAVALQNAEIQRLNPRDNFNDGRSSTDAGELPPV